MSQRKYTLRVAVHIPREYDIKTSPSYAYIPDGHCWWCQNWHPSWGWWISVTNFVGSRTGVDSSILWTDIPEKNSCWSFLDYYSKTWIESWRVHFQFYQQKKFLAHNMPNSIFTWCCDVRFLIPKASEASPLTNQNIRWNFLLYKQITYIIFCHLHPFNVKPFTKIWHWLAIIVLSMQ